MNPAQPPTRRTRVNANRRGFGLLELMIAMLVVAVLLGLAIPSYRQYVSRAHRAEAVRTLLAAASCQERIRAQSGYYDTARCASGLDDRHYTYLIEPAGEPASLTYRLVAIPLGRALADRCGSLTLNHAGTRAVSAAGASVADCWGGR
jgi:type IV pilus assembly protein PilE